tara:strand:- start:194 stop:319 length:126 start_codon:yes stop_codon:yes gene_type:complete
MEGFPFKKLLGQMLLPITFTTGSFKNTMGKNTEGEKENIRN